MGGGPAGVCVCARVYACVLKGVMVFNAAFNNISVTWWRFVQVDTDSFE